jgi:hypothetical protein
MTMRITLLLAVAGLAGLALLTGCTTAVTQGTIEGTVADGDQVPVGGSWITVEQEGTEYARVPADDQGKYRVTNLEPGTYDVTASPPASRSSELGSDGPYPVTVKGGGTTVRNFFLPPAGGTLTGTVRLPSGTTAQAATVTVSQGTTIVATATTNAQGQYSITEIDPGVYSVTASLANFGDSLTASVTITSGQTTTQDLDLTQA